MVVSWPLSRCWKVLNDGLLFVLNASNDDESGNTSVNLDGGSLRPSEFQIPVAHGKELELEAARPIPIPLDVVCAFQAPISAAGVLGFDAVGDMELLANEPFLGWGCVVSFSHEARRVGF